MAIHNSRVTFLFFLMNENKGSRISRLFQKTTKYNKKSVSSSISSLSLPDPYSISSSQQSSQHNLLEYDSGKQIKRGCVKKSSSDYMF